MKRMMLWLLVVLLIAVPLLALAEGEESSGDGNTGMENTGTENTGTENPAGEEPAGDAGEDTVIGEALSIDTVHVYADMEKSYAAGYVPTVANDTATIVLPLVGNVRGNRIRVTPELSSGGPYVLGNYQFDVLKTQEVASDQSVNEVFLVRLVLPLNASRYNGTYDVPFTVEYVTTDGAQAQQSFSVRLSITDGKNQSSGGGYYQPSVQKPIVLVESFAVDPDPACGGDTATVTLVLKNVGTLEAKNLRVSLVPESDALTVDALNATFLPSLPVQKTVETAIVLQVRRGAPGGDSIVSVHIEYEDRLGNSYGEESRFAVPVTQPRVEIAAIDYAQSIGGGGDVTVTLTLRNTGDRDAESVSIAYDGADESIRQKGSADALAIGTLRAGESREATVELRVLPSASEGKHAIGFVLSYTDAPSGGAYRDSVSYPLTVVQKAQIGYDDVRLPESMTSGESFSQPVCVYNTGFTPIYNVRCSLVCDGLICSSAFLGTLGPQQSADKTMTVFVTTLSDGQKYGTTYGSFEITYEDADGRQYMEQASVQMNILEPQKQTDEELERERQRVEDQQLLSQWWVSVLIGIAVICILIAVLVTAKFMRMLKMK